jgi:hypothetical protein
VERAPGPLRIFKLFFQRAAELSGGSRGIPLPEPALSTNPYPFQRNCMDTAKDL